MKIKTIAILLFVMLNNCVYSQEGNEIKKEVGFDITSIFDVLKSNSYHLSSDNILVYYKINRGESTTRMGFGGSFQLEKSDKISTINLNFLIGQEKNNILSNRWTIYHGFDFKALLSTRYSKNKLNNQLNIALGWAPLIGIKFKILPELWLSTEMSYGFFIGVNDPTGQSEFSAFTNLFAPRSLFLFYSF